LPIDDSRDVSWREQMVVVLRYVDKCGILKERFVGLVHVIETTSFYLKLDAKDMMHGARYMQSGRR